MPNHPIRGFTLIELILVIVILGILASLVVPRFIDLTEEAKQASLAQQATALRSNNNINVAACKLGNEACIDITTTGTAAFEDALDAFLPGVDTALFAVGNIDSNTPEESWHNQAKAEQGELYWVDRFLKTPPSDSWLAGGWNPRQPCIIKLAEP